LLSKFLTSTPAGKIYLGMPRRRWEDSIRMNLKEICINTRNWVNLTQSVISRVQGFLREREKRTNDTETHSPYKP
jgi:hypothetical protein